MDIELIMQKGSAGVALTTAELKALMLHAITLLQFIEEQPLDSISRAQAAITAITVSPENAKMDKQQYSQLLNTGMLLGIHLNSQLAEIDAQLAQSARLAHR